MTLPFFALMSFRMKSAGDFGTAKDTECGEARGVLLGLTRAAAAAAAGDGDGAGDDRPLDEAPAVVRRFVAGDGLGLEI